MRPSHPPFSSFGWTVAGALALGLSFPPTGFYPLAWVALVPWLVRWRLATSPAAYAREIYAAALVWSCSAGFWLLFHPDPGRAAAGGLGVLVVPLPLAFAFVAALWARLRYGTAVGLAALVVNVLLMEYAMLHLPGGVPWLLLGHTQAAATPFLQIADLGGVLLVSAWVLAVNLVAMLALDPRPATASTPAPAAGARPAERGLAVAALAMLIVAPVLYGAAQAVQPVAPVGYARVGLVQPGVAADTWELQSATERIEALADLSGSMLERWRGGTASVRDSAAVSDNLAAAPGERAVGMLIWPQASLPDVGTDAAADRLMQRLGAWCDAQGVDLLAGGTLPSSALTREVSQTADDGTITETSVRPAASAALLVRAHRAPMRYDQMRRLPLGDARAPRGRSRTLFPSGGARLATTLGFESLYGDHVRTFARDGADAVVVLAQTGWWGRGGAAQHLAFTRLRAIETRRAVLVSAVGGGSSLVSPSGEIETLAGWMQPALVPLDVPLYREATFYTRHGDWVGQWALWLALAGNVAMMFWSRLASAAGRTPRRRRGAV